MSGSVLLALTVSEWAWLFGFALVSLALVALAVLADALYEGYRHRIRHAAPAVPETHEAPDESSTRQKKAA